jgi:hypothetical protein
VSALGLALVVWHAENRSLYVDLESELQTATAFCVCTGHLNNNVSNRLTKPFDKPRTRTQDGIPGSSYNGCDIYVACISSLLFLRGSLFTLFCLCELTFQLLVCPVFAQRGWLAQTTWCAQADACNSAILPRT